MTGAEESFLLRLRHDGARQVRAFLPERDEVVFARPDQHARFMFFRISEDQRLADAELLERRDLAHRRPPAPLSKKILEDDPELAGDESKARQDHKLREVAPSDIM